MKNELKKKLIITSGVTALPVLVGLCLWRQLPDVVATHFAADGTPNGWSSKGSAVFGLPAFLTLVNVVCTMVTENDPRRQSYPEPLVKIMYWICPAVSWICAGAVFGQAFGMDMADMGRWMILVLGGVFVVIGKYLPSVQQNRYLGIKLPWTYADEENWKKTHQFGGKCWMVGGGLLILNFFLTFSPSPEPK